MYSYRDVKDYTEDYAKVNFDMCAKFLKLYNMLRQR